jgi:hypothetical protein
MRRPTRSLPYVVAAAMLVTLVACGSDDEPDADPEPTPTASPSTPTASPSDDRPAGGPADAPAPLTAETEVLGWKPVEGPVDDVVTRNEEWTLTVPEDGATSKLVKQTAGGRSSGQAGANPGWTVSDTLLDEDWAVVVLQDKAEEKPGRATVTDLETGKSFTLDGASDIPTTNGGTWALGDDGLLHATVDKAGAYCLVSVDLTTRSSEIAWCAPKQSGFNAAHSTDAGDSILTFDDADPACRTVVTVAGGAITPFEGVSRCNAYEGVAVDDGAVWSVIPDEERIEEAHLYARVGDGYFDLGPGAAGSLTWCDDAAYFTRDPQEQDAAAALMRWSPDDGLTVAYESPKGEAFIESPRCGGDAITITARTSSGDEQVTADL